MEIDSTRMCELLVGLPDVDVVGVEVTAGGLLKVHISCRERDAWCRTCGARAESKDRPKIELVDLPASTRASLMSREGNLPFRTLSGYPGGSALV